MSQLIPGEVRTNGIKLHYYRTALEPRHAWPTLVMLHGVTDSGQCWPRVAQALAPEYGLVLPDARGHGLSDKPESGYSPADHAGRCRRADPRAQTRSARCSSATRWAAGWLRPRLRSTPTWWAASSWRIRPGCRQTDAERDTRAQRAAEWRQRILEEQALTPQQLIAKRRGDMPLWDDVEFTDWVNAKMQVSPDVTNFILELDKPWQQTAVAIQCPTLLIGADVSRGAIVGAAQAATAQAINSNIQVALISGSGHNIRREQFEAYMAVVRRFLEELQPA